MEEFILNVIHRPEMVPEYSATVTGHGKEEDIGNKKLLTESLDIFKTQQRIAHENGLKVTIHMTYAALFNEEAVAVAKHDHEQYGDEIALSLLGLPCEEFRNKYKTKDFCIWMFSMEDKKAIVDDVFGKFRDIFGFYPESTGSYYMDAELTNYIKEKYPSVKCAIATCWEEGPKAYHTCNNSWYTLFDGGPWAPWIPSKQNTHAPAANQEEDSGIVAIPHLSRDLLACYDGNGSNFGTHPQNVLRGMIYDTKTWEYLYLYNLIDQYRAQAKYNHGYAYNMMFVGPGWMNKMGRWEAPYELLLKSYSDGCKYYGDLKKEGKLIDMTMSEFADYYRKKKTYTEPECALWRDILYGSDKQLFWYADPYMRAGVNMDQGGAVFDLRPYAAKLKWEVGIGTKHIQDASYPFLIQEKYRAGYFTHYAGEGTIRSAKLCYEGEEVDLCLCRTKAHFSQEGKTRILTLNPVEIQFARLAVKLQTRLFFEEGTGAIRIERKILEMSVPGAEVEIQEYMVACYGTTEYPEDMSGIILKCEGKEPKEIIYAYKCREESLKGAKAVSAVIPAINTKVSMEASEGGEGYIREGYAFSPMFTLGYKKKVSDKEVLFTVLESFGVNAVCLRVFVNPPKEAFWMKHEDEKVMLGFCDTQGMVSMAERVKGHGMKLMVDFHYSDHFADPVIQDIPREWENDSDDQLEEKVYGHTRQVLRALTVQGIYPEWVQVGNEINNGMMWPKGSLKDAPEALVRFLNAGYEAVKEICPDCQVITHLASVCNKALCEPFWENFFRNHGKTDILGFSYYPYWEKFESDQKRLADCLRGYAKTYHKPVIITEVGGPDADEESSYQIVADAVGAMKEMDQEELGIFYWEPEGTARILPDGYPLCAARMVGEKTLQFNQALGAYALAP